MSHSVAVESRTFVPRGDFMAWVVCLSAGLFFLYEFFQLNIFDVINQSLREDFHIDATQLSWMSSTYLWLIFFFFYQLALFSTGFQPGKLFSPQCLFVLLEQ